MRFGKAGERLVPVKLRAHLTEVGTLEIWADSKISEHRWRLQFELRKTADARTRRQAGGGGQRRSAGASGSITRSDVSRRNADARRAARQAGTDAGAGAQFLAAAARSASSPIDMLELAETRRKSARAGDALAESCRLLLRPGFGFPGDDFRIEQARRIYAERPSVRQSSAERNRLVDLLGPRRGRA